jgi:hypothetical protein
MRHAIAEIRIGRFVDGGDLPGQPALQKRDQRLRDTPRLLVGEAPERPHAEAAPLRIGEDADGRLALGLPEQRLEGERIDIGEEQRGVDRPVHQPDRSRR